MVLPIYEGDCVEIVNGKIKLLSKAEKEASNLEGDAKDDII